ncbi:Exodeoxyribonuclease 7 small subunit [Apilactobacillus kunkeei]|jgi:exodeoxyribonuclease VII small subunit|uniref:Exodeoxyribonuclease 7 small subunit n=3 Tax=Apilactobacillus TaxID=2767877 RepID=A0A087EQ10_9LACO|nr:MULTISPECIES: exodeoxyribonuclease VII small subunit [Lactobacillaceae]ALJ31870.1 exodeoxyribonuclease VII small subunit [Apilactobacillus kunkeei]KFJ15361.1 exodeoxyribonuclease VII small subunit [Apilactobacillus kunkeei]KOY69892.1 Exodeoxyribonuclease 7 small subunit [Apilactobacillus kunkeei]KOY71254.1 Exodeoxyribonuclease 7 small subunit [Apilactobacillus kunkeei]KOY73007.1 Exodeoxyribonuclease 7 small subunit [Apilactobacillus kunkeei DSM 12361 = ATCC 700308]
MAEKASFEDNMNKLEQIVSELEQGDIPLEKALSEFQKGVKLSGELQSTLKNAEKTLAKEMTDDDSEVAFEKESEDK